VITVKQFSKEKKTQSTSKFEAKPRNEVMTYEEDHLHGCSKEIKYVVEGECWICVSHFFYDKPVGSYVSIHRHGGPIAIHRHIWQKENGRYLKPGEIVVHSCGNHDCLNPGHLILDKRNRVVGYKKRKLSMRQAEEIRREAAKGTSQMVLAVEYGVCQATIYNIVRGKTYVQAPSAETQRAA
jgi:hypothetical protein